MSGREGLSLGGECSVGPNVRSAGRRNDRGQLAELQAGRAGPEDNWTEGKDCGFVLQATSSAVPIRQRDGRRVGRVADWVLRERIRKRQGDNGGASVCVVVQFAPGR